MRFSEFSMDFFIEGGKVLALGGSDDFMMRYDTRKIKILSYVFFF